MSLKDKASFIFKPSRYKAGTAFTFRGGDLVSSRGSTATRVNAQGYIETVAANVPRVNYDPTDLTKEPWILYEDSATNLVSSGITLQDISKTNMTANPGYPSPDAESGKGVKLEVSAITNAVTYLSTSFSASNGTKYTASIYAKAAEYPSFQFHHYGSAGIKVDLRNGTVVDNAGDTTYGIQEYNDGWWRVWMTWTSSQTSSDSVYISPTPEPTSAYYYTSTGGKGIYVYGLQVEANVTVPTSLIKTIGSTVTRSSDTLYLNSVSNVIGSGQGVVYCDFYGQPGATGGYEGMFSINTGSFSHSINIFKSTNGTFYYEIYTAGTAVVGTTYNSSTTTSYRTKMAIYYSDNDFGLYINGVRVHTDTSGTAPTGMSSINFNAPAGSYPGTKDLYEFLLFKERLSDEELVALTSFDDYEEVVDIKDLTWESSTITNNRLSELAAL